MVALKTNQLFLDHARGSAVAFFKLVGFHPLSSLFVQRKQRLPSGFHAVGPSMVFAARHFGF
jgi:hypothetical protein